MTWPIPAENESDRQPFDSHQYWVTSHERKNYADVFSVTEDYGLRVRVADLLREHVGASPSRVLVPGCGSRTLLERHLLEAFSACTIVATDYDAVAELASTRLIHERVAFVSRDSRYLNFRDEFDAAVVVNSILSGEDADNRLAFDSICAALRDNGYLVGMFPTVFSTLDIGYSVPGETWRLKSVQPETCRFNEATQGHSQIFYTPLRLNAILKDAGFDDVRMEIFFCDSILLRNEAERIYAIRGHNVFLYELLLVARKRPKTERPIVR